MSTPRWLLALVSGAALGWAACGGGASPAGTGGADCSGGPFFVTCDQCIESACCAVASTCYADSLCFACASATPASPAACAKHANPKWDALLACASTSCNAACIPESVCNPVTSQGCDVGAACDLDQDGVYACFPAGADAALCATCSNADGPFCEATLHCVEQGATHACARYCCSDGDCGSGRCDTSSVSGGVGVCVKVLDGGAEAGLEPACDPPATAPSQGSCFTIPDAGPG